MVSKTFFNCLLPGAQPACKPAPFAARPGRLTALQLAESGYAPLNPPEWIERLHPQVALLSVAAGDREGRPSAETLEAVEGYNLLRTDRNGWIELATDGERCGWR